MLQITGLSSNPLQKKVVVLPDGTKMLLEIYYRPNQQDWLINEVSTPTFVARGISLTANPNILRQFKNLISFGLACFVEGNREPSQLQDFQSGAAKLYVLTAQEVRDYEAYLAGG